MNETGEIIEIQKQKPEITAMEFYADDFDQKAYLKSLSVMEQVKFMGDMPKEIAKLPAEEQKRIHDKIDAQVQAIKDKPNKSVTEKFWLGLAKVSEKTKKFKAKLFSKSA